MVTWPFSKVKKPEHKKKRSIYNKEISQFSCVWLPTLKPCKKINEACSGNVILFFPSGNATKWLIIPSHGCLFYSSPTQSLHFLHTEFLAFPGQQAPSALLPPGLWTCRVHAQSSLASFRSLLKCSLLSICSPDLYSTIIITILLLIHLFIYFPT